MIGWLAGDGIEIGALHRPLPLPPGARVRYVDRMREEELRRHYPELDGESLVSVDILGSAEDLAAVGSGSVDFVVANHLLEHLEDPIRALAEFHRVLRPDGVLYLALPDPRVSFDRDRQLTTLQHLLDEHRHGAAPNRRAHYLDWATHVDQDPAPESRAEKLMAMDYSIHFHVWRPDTFLDFLVAARREEHLEFELAAFAPPEHPQDDEFVVVILKGAPNRLRLQPALSQDSPTSARALSAGRRLRARVAASPLGPPLRPAYRTLRKWSRRLRRRAQPAENGAQETGAG